MKAGEGKLVTRWAPGDPDAVEAQLARLRNGRKLWEDILWPGGDTPIRIRVLAVSEIQMSLAGARRRFKALELELDHFNVEEMGAEQILQILARAVCDPGKPIGGKGMCEPLFQNADVMRDTVSHAELNALFDHYIDLQEECDPTDATIDPETYGKIMEAAKKKDVGSLRGYGSATLRSFITSTVRQPAS